MPDNATLFCYQVADCGYYERGVGSPKFGSFPEVVDALTAWLTACGPLADTCPYEPDEENDILETYRFQIVTGGSHGDVLLTTWNRVADRDALAHVDPRATMNAAKANKTKIPGNNIPGYPAYFWMVPEKNVVVAIKFGGRQNGQPRLRRFIAAFLGNTARWVVRVPDADTDPDEDGEVERNIGYSDGSAEPENLIPKFLLRRRAVPSKLAEIKDRRSEIVKVLYKSTLSHASGKEKKFASAALRALGIDRETLVDNKLQTRLELPVKMLTAADLGDIVSAWEAGDKAWNDVGFMFRGETRPRWLGGAVARLEQEWPTLERRGVAMDGEALFNALQKRRTKLLAALMEAK